MKNAMIKRGLSQDLEDAIFECFKNSDILKIFGKETSRSKKGTTIIEWDGQTVNRWFLDAEDENLFIAEPCKKGLFLWTSM